MANRMFVAAVFSLWLGSMSWLFVDRVLPSFYEGEPPTALAHEPGKAVGWLVQWKGRDVGQAVSIRADGVGGTSEIHNRVHLNDIPLMDLAPAWMRHAVGDFGRLEFDATTRVEFDSLGTFSAFESKIQVNDIPSVLQMSGRVKEGHLKLKVRSGETVYSPNVQLSNQAALSEALFPDPLLTNLREGRTWREEVYSPFRPPTHPTEPVEARVLGKETIEVNGERVKVMCVEYLSASSSGISQASRRQAKSWVDMNGVVMQRDVYLGRSKLRFVRLPDETSAALSDEFFPALKLSGVRAGVEL
ncbi:MAG: hypothetical protein AAGA92_05650 [Planctomycetota bacterium]